MRPIERKIQDMEVRTIVTTGMVFNVVNFLVFGTLIGLMLFNPKNFLGVD